MSFLWNSKKSVDARQRSRKQTIELNIKRTEARRALFESKCDDCTAELRNIKRALRGLRTNSDKATRLRTRAQTWLERKQMYANQEQRCNSTLLSLENKLLMMDDVHEINQMNEITKEIEADMKEGLGIDAVGAEERSISIEDVFAEVNDVSESLSRPCRTGRTRRIDDDDLDAEFDALSDSESDEDIQRERSHGAKTRTASSSSSSSSSRLRHSPVSDRAASADVVASPHASSRGSRKPARRGNAADIVDDYVIPT